MWPLVFIPLFAGFWCVGCLMLAKMGGWSELAARFPARGRPAGETFRFQAAKIGIAHYNGVLTAIKTEQGLYLAVFLPWRFGHPALLIPWTEMKDAVAREVLWSRWVDVKVGVPRSVCVRLPAKLVAGKLPV